MSFSGSDTSSLSNITGNQSNANYYDPDRAYTQKLMAYEMYGNQGVTGSEANPFNEGPATNNAKLSDYQAAPGDWQQGGGHLPNSPITPNDTLPPPDGSHNNYWDPNQGVWNDHPQTPPGGGGGGGNPNPFGGGRDTRILTNREVGPNMPSQHVGDPGTDTNPLTNPNRHDPNDPNYPQGPPREFGTPPAQRQPNPPNANPMMPIQPVIR